MAPELSTFDAAIDAIKTVGVPAAALFWLLWRTDKRVERLSERIDKLVDTIHDKRL